MFFKRKPITSMSSNTNLNEKPDLKETPMYTLPTRKRSNPDSDLRIKKYPT